MSNRKKLSDHHIEASAWLHLDSPNINDWQPLHTIRYELTAYVDDTPVYTGTTSQADIVASKLYDARGAVITELELIEEGYPYGQED